MHSPGRRANRRRVEAETAAPTGAAPASQRGEQTADNIRYGQNVSESGMGGMTAGQGGGAAKATYGAVKDQGGEEQAEGRSAAGYGGGEDMKKNIGG